LPETPPPAVPGFLDYRHPNDQHHRSRDFHDTAHRSRGCPGEAVNFGHSH
jgi:hypothetical protein